MYQIHLYLQVDLPDPDFPDETEPSLLFMSDVQFDSAEEADRYVASIKRLNPNLPGSLEVVS